MNLLGTRVSNTIKSIMEPAPPEDSSPRDEQQQVDGMEAGASVEDCIICCTAIIPSDATSLRCGHKFHTSCLQTWLKRKPTCPMCREEAHEQVLVSSASQSTQAEAEQVVLTCEVCNKEFCAKRYKSLADAQSARR